jgi:thiamine biosynthesis protein ThiI
MPRRNQVVDIIVKSSRTSLSHEDCQARIGSTTKYDSVIIRFSGEIGIKSEWTRRTYERLLLKNIERTLVHDGLGLEQIAHTRGRIYIKARSPEQIASRLTRLFGISSVSPAIQTLSAMDEIVETALKVGKGEIANGSTFAVRCHRVGTHTYSSMDVCKEVGKQILTNFKDRNLRVDLTNPQFTMNVESRDEEAYVYTVTLHGAGGFPVGSQPKVVCLLSGGIDSPVASWLVMKRGCPITPIYLDNAPLTDETATVKAVEIARKLFEWSIGYSTRMYIVPHGKNLETFLEKSPRRLTCLLCKRMMYRIAERIADIEKAEGIVTGEAIGEQASQTITNLRVLDEATVKYPVHRPLLGFDKTETEQLARKIGTFELSIRKAKGCSGAPSQPATKARLEIVKEAEAKLDVEGMAEESVEAAKIITV